MQDNVTLEIILEKAVFTFHGQDVDIEYEIREPYLHDKKEWLSWKARVESDDDIIPFHSVSFEGKGDETSLYIQLSKKVFGKSLIKCLDQMIANPACWKAE